MSSQLTGISFAVHSSPRNGGVNETEHCHTHTNAFSHPISQCPSMTTVIYAMAHHIHLHSFQAKSCQLLMVVYDIEPL